MPTMIMPTIEEVKAQLPNVRVRFQGKIFNGNVRGRLNKLATVSIVPSRTYPNQYVEDKFSWEAIQHSINTDTPLQF